jgi:RNA polymerase sigma factor (sigma-70 family)
MYHTETAAVEVTAACARLAPLPSARHDMPDATLIARIATGDRLAMHALFARRKTRVYRFILRLVGDAASADDLTSEVFLGVWRHAHKFRGRAAASTWLLAVARFKGLDELRRRRDDARNLEELDASDPAADPEASWADNHRGAMLRKCLGALSPSTAQSSTSFIITRSRCKRSRRSSGFRAQRSKPGCSTRARSSPPCLPRKG